MYMVHCQDCPGQTNSRGDKNSGQILSSLGHSTLEVDCSYTYPDVLCCLKSPVE